MAPESHHRQLLSQFLEALKRTTLEAVEGEDSERRNISTNRAHGSLFQARAHNLRRDADMLQQAVELLKEQRKVFERLTAYARNATQPICRLPDEILSCIFEVGTPDSFDHWDPDWNPRLTRTLPPTPTEHMSQLASISATCSRFRIVVANTPRCWTYVSCTVSGGKAPGTRLAALRTMLARSKSCMFTLGLELQAEHFSPSAYTLQALSSILLPHMHRCQALRLVSDDRGVDFPLITPFQNVQQLSFEWGEERDRDGEDEGTEDLDVKAESTFHSFIAALSKPLRSLALDCPVKGLQTMDRDFSTIQAQALTRLRISVCCSVAHVFQLLQRCTLLKHLDWTVEGTGNEARHYHVVMENLVSLQVFDACGEGGLWTLKAPRLEQLRFEGHFGIPFDISRPSHSTFPSLTRVAVTYPWNLDDVALFLLRHPLLNECILDMRPDTATVVDGICGLLESLLTPRPNPNDHNLQHLSISLHFAALFQEAGRIRASLGVLMRELSLLHVDVHILGLVGPLRGLDPDGLEDGNRFSPNPPVHRESLWPNAWGEL